MTSTRKPMSAVFVGAWTVVALALFLGIGLLPAVFGVAGEAWATAVAKLSGPIAVPLVASGALFSTGQRVAGVAIAAFVLLAISALSASIILRAA